MLKNILLFLPSLWMCYGYAANYKFGGEEEKDPNNPEYKNLAEESFQKYRDDHNGLHFTVKELLVTKVTIQTVAGEITRLDFKAIPTKGNLLQCHSEILERLWEQYKEITVTCTPQSSLKLSNGLIGGQSEQDPNNPKYKKLAEESFQKYRDDHNGLHFTVKELLVTKVTTQVVAGYITRLDFKAIPTKGSLLQCHSEILEKSWEQIKDITVTCTPQSNLKLSNGLIGGQSEQDPNNPKYKKLAKESFQKYRDDHNGLDFTVKELLVTKVTIQTVAGEMTRLDFKAIPTKGYLLQCHSEILERLWEQYKEITVTCTPQSSLKLSNGLIGGQSEQDPNNPKYKKLAEESFQKYRDDHNGLHFTVKELLVTKVTIQTVAGEMTRLDFKAIPTKGKLLQCHSEILERLWEQYKEITVTCTPQSNLKLSNGLIGGQSEQDPNNPKYKKLAEESFEKYRDDHNGLDFTVKQLLVTKVTTQVVSGYITRLDFKAIPTKGNLLQCHSEIFEKSWEQIKDITVTCTPQSNLKLSNGLIGGQSEQIPNNPKYKKLAEESFEKYRDDHNGLDFTVKQLLVTKVTTQVVSGYITRLDFKAIPTKGNLLQCHSEIFEKSWEQFKDITVTCTPQSNLKLSNGLIGGQSEQIPNNPKYKKLAEESFQKYRDDHNGLHFTVKELLVTKVTIQTVAGEMTRLDFKAIPTKGKLLQCHSEILERLWEQYKEITVTCTPESGAKLLSKEENPNSPKYKKFAEESIQKYLDEDNGRVFKIKDLLVERVTTEVLPDYGVVTDLDFKAIPTNGIYHYYILQCHSMITEKQQQEEKDIDVHCVSPAEAKFR